MVGLRAKIIIILFLIVGSNSEAQAFLQRDGQVIIRMRGLPFDATARDVVSIRIMHVQLSVLKWCSI